MYPSSFKIRAISALIFEYGINTSGFCARVPLRTRARKSAIGSVTVLMKSGGLRGGLLCPVAKGHSHFAQQRFGFLVGLGRGDDSNIKSDVALDFIQLHLGENRLIRNSQGIVTMVIKAARRHPTEITDAWQRRFNEAFEKFVHALST